MEISSRMPCSWLPLMPQWRCTRSKSRVDSVQETASGWNENMNPSLSHDEFSYGNSIPHGPWLPLTSYSRQNPVLIHETAPGWNKNMNLVLPTMSFPMEASMAVGDLPSVSGAPTARIFRLQVPCLHFMSTYKMWLTIHHFLPHAYISPRHVILHHLCPLQVISLSAAQSGTTSL